jgi:hypothetical protein
MDGKWTHDSIKLHYLKYTSTYEIIWPFISPVLSLFIIVSPISNGLSDTWNISMCKGDFISKLNWNWSFFNKQIKEKRKRTKTFRFTNVHLDFVINYWRKQDIGYCETYSGQYFEKGVRGKKRKRSIFILLG